MASRQNCRGGRRTDNDNTAPPDGEVIPDVLHDANENVPRNENMQAEDHQHQRQQEDDDVIRDETADIMEEEQNVNTELRADDFMVGNTVEANQNIDEAPLPLGEVESNIEEDFERLRIPGNRGRFGGQFDGTRRANNNVLQGNTVLRNNNSTSLSL